VLNRGVTLESLGRYEEAAADYQAVLLAQPNDPAAWNNLGNVKVCEILLLPKSSCPCTGFQSTPCFLFAGSSGGV
jgi:tetratricopeptide (TPR) repeat protein